MENIQWKVDGMSCTNCALSIHKYLNSKGIKEPKVNFMEGEVQFELVDTAQKPPLIKGIQDLGYKVRGQEKEIEVKKWLDLKSSTEKTSSCNLDQGKSPETDNRAIVLQHDQIVTPGRHECPKQPQYPLLKMQSVLLYFRAQWR